MSISALGPSLLTLAFVPHIFNPFYLWFPHVSIIFLNKDSTGG